MINYFVVVNILSFIYLGHLMQKELDFILADYFKISYLASVSLFDFIVIEYSL